MAFGFPIFSESFRHTYFLIFGAPWAILCTIGILGLAYRRFVIKPEALGKFSSTSALVSVFIVTLMTTYLIDELHILSGAAEKFNWWFFIFNPTIKTYAFGIITFQYFFAPI